MEVQMTTTTTTYTPSWWCELSHRRAAECKVITVESYKEVCEKGQLAEVVDALSLLVKTGSRLSTSVYYSALRRCLGQENLVLGRQIHALAVEGGYQTNTFLANHILRMYASHGRLQEASQVFAQVPAPDIFMWSSLVSAYTEHGEPTQALRLYQKMRRSTVKPNSYIFVAALKACSASADLESGRQVHADVLNAGFLPDTFISNCLLDMYVKCGSLKDARKVFDSSPTRNVVTWNSIINGYAKHGPGHEALALYAKMEQEGTVVADSVTFTGLLKACGSIGGLQDGKQFHSQILERGLHANVVVGTCLVDMYAKCGSLEDAREVFDSLPSRNVVTWNTMINAYTEHGLSQQALALYSGSVEQEGIAVGDKVTFACLLKACARVGDLQQGKKLHSQIVERGLDSNVVVGTCLVDMYAKCGSLEEARRVFDHLPTRNVVTWNSMINGYADHGCSNDAFDLYASMESEDMVIANEVTFAGLLKACTRTRALQQGKQLHSQIVERGLNSNPVIGTCLVDMYAKCGSLQEAHVVFDDLSTRNVVTWNSMINGYTSHGLCQEALALYASMKQEGTIVGDRITFACLLKACATVRALHEGEQLHLHIVERGLLDERLVGNSLVDMYVECGSLDSALQVFSSMPSRDVVTWNTMIAGYTENGLHQEALALYARMEQEGMVEGDKFTFVCLLKACASSKALDEGKQLHLQILDKGLLTESLVVGNCLVDMYAKCSCLEDALEVFERLPGRDVVTWSTIIAGYTEHGLGQEALALYARMEQEDKIVADGVTFACLLKACARMGAIQQGKQLHALMEERGLAGDMVLGSCLVDMYATWGCLKDACRVFDSLPKKDVITWTALLDGFGRCNQGQLAMQCFQDMLQDGVAPDATTFVCLLVACSHEGLVTEGRHFFNDMVEAHNIVPSSQHYVCMVDLLGRSGYLDEAEQMLQSVSSADSCFVGWTSLLSACRSHCDTELATRCFDNLIRLQPGNAAAYVVMANIYADAGRWTDVDRIEYMRQCAGASKKPAMARIEVNMQVYTFAVGEGRGHDISFKSRSMNVRLKEEGGHVPRTERVLKPIPEKEKEDELCGHAEKLALAYGLLNTPDGTALLVTKNLRMCGDCHSATRIMSRVEKREIVVRDAHRVHRFAEGSCSCGNRP